MPVASFPQTRIPKVVLAVTALLAVLVAPITATSVSAAEDRCLDIELLTTPDAVTEADGPIFEVPATVQVEVRVTNGDGDAFQEGGDDDVVGTFDCPGTPLVGETVELAVSLDYGADSTTTPTSNDVGAVFVDVDGTERSVAQVRATAEGDTPDDFTYGWHYFGFSERGFPGAISCEPDRQTMFTGEQRSFLVAVVDSYADPVADAPIDLGESGSDPNDFVLDDELTDENGQLTGSYSIGERRNDYWDCWVDLDGDDVRQYDTDGGNDSVATYWLPPTAAAEADVEVDADSGHPFETRDELPDGDVSFYCVNDYGDINDAGVDGAPFDANGNSTDDTLEASRTGLPVNAVVPVCMEGRWSDPDGGEVTLYRERTVEIVNGPGEFLDENGASLGTTYVDSPSAHETTVWLSSTGPGTTTIVGTYDGFDDTDTVTVTWDALTADDARVLACEGGQGIRKIDRNVDITCTVTDGFDNPVPGATVSAGATNAARADTTAPADETTDANGQVTFTVTSSTVGDTTVTPRTVEGDCAPGSTDDGLDVGRADRVCGHVIEIEWDVHGPVDLDNGVDVDPGLPGDSTDVDTGDQEITVTLTDEDGDPVDGVVVDVVVVGPNGGVYTGVTGDDGSVVITIPGDAPGNDEIEVRVDGDNDDVAETSVFGVVVQRNAAARFAGDDRRKTAILASQDRFDDDAAGAVVLAREDLFADALAGTPFAVGEDAPILLTPTTSLHPDTLAEIDRVLPDGGTVYALGGEVALAPAVVDALTPTWTVERLAGPDRYATAVEIADATTTSPSRVLVTTGQSFPDALAAGAAAAATNGVIVLSAGAAPATATTTYLASSSAPATAIGGPAASAYPALASLVGTTRLDTALKVAQEYFDTPETVGIARSDDFPDGLSGGAHIGRSSGPLLLVSRGDGVAGLDHADNQPVRDYLVANKSSLYAAFVYGGTVAVLDVVDGQLAAAIR